jgi:ribosome-associated protein
MADEALLRVNDQLAIPRTELDYRATRSGGPGGQHVNTSATRIELTWNVRSSAALDEDQRARLLGKLASRLDAEGNLRLVSSASRSQYQNREAADQRLVRIVAAALRRPRPRKATRVPRAAREARLQEKRQRARVKKERGRVERQED